jgi:hypothetical protein
MTAEQRRAKQRALAMTKRERVDYLKAHGWRCVDSGGSQQWVIVDGWVFTLAEAILDQLGSETLR